MDNTLFIVVPAYNEAENIGRLIDEWYPVVEKHNETGKNRLIVINDGSKDETLSILTNKAKNKQLLISLDKPNGGHGSAVLYGYRYAIENDADWIFQTDSDGQTNPAEFEQFWQLKEEYDAIIGSRPKREDGLSRLVVEKILLIILRIVFGVKMPDSNAPFRL